MKKLNKTYNIIYTLLFVMFITSVASAQKYQSLVKEAEQLYNMGAFDDAIITCERYLYFSTDKTEKNRILFIEAKSFQQKKNYQNSSNILLSIPRINLEPHFKSLIDYNLALNSYLGGLYDEAEVYLEKCDTTVLDEQEKTNFEFLKLLNLCYMAKWEEAKNLIQQSFYFSDLQKLALIKLLTSPPSMLNQNKLEWYSRFIPGSGQLAAGYISEGVLSFSFCAGSLVLGTLLVINGYYVSGYFLGAGLLYAFYYGGIRRLNEIVEFENQKRKNNFVDSVKTVLQQ